MHQLSQTTSMADRCGDSGFHGPERAPAWAQPVTTRVTRPDRKATYGFFQGELTPTMASFSHMQEGSLNKGQEDQPQRNYQRAKGWRAAMGVPRAPRTPSTKGNGPFLGWPIRPFDLGGPTVCPMAPPFLGVEKGLPCPPPFQQDDQDRVPRGTNQFSNFMSKDPPVVLLDPHRRDFAQETTSREVGFFAALAEARARLGGGGYPAIFGPQNSCQGRQEWPAPFGSGYRDPPDGGPE